ncbi:hypothetical protein DPMN_006571 [Dreissena polymorpha]|uniref:Uncharacterized protein n=1 Tax=Dreissena polymorpha TaxID=45954 RepID=A0A9D4MWS8_DREPO|nr:hypothetical protein DPMN_006571 [Dreissena polymorpha]
MPWISNGQRETVTSALIVKSDKHIFTCIYLCVFFLRILLNYHLIIQLDPLRLHCGQHVLRLLYTLWQQSEFEHRHSVGNAVVAGRVTDVVASIGRGWVVGGVGVAFGWLFELQSDKNVQAPWKQTCKKW